MVRPYARLPFEGDAASRMFPPATRKCLLYVDSGRPVCAKSGHSPNERKTRLFDPRLKFLFLRAEMACLSLMFLAGAPCARLRKTR